MVNKAAWEELVNEFEPLGVTLVAVSKKKPAEDIAGFYELGQRDFGENYVQELTEKQPLLPNDIRWHFIGHLQGNKVKEIAPFVHLIHAVDSFKLLKEINKEAAKNNRIIDVLLQMHIADEETKFGLDKSELVELISSYETQIAELANIRICGLMGMATNTTDEQKISEEFSTLHNFFKKLAATNFAGKDYFTTCSMGMTSDYKLAIESGSNMVRIGSLLFGSRRY